jgi:hypothetical protein
MATMEERKAAEALAELQYKLAQIKANSKRGILVTFMIALIALTTVFQGVIMYHAVLGAHMASYVVVGYYMAILVIYSPFHTRYWYKAFDQKKQLKKLAMSKGVVTKAAKKTLPNKAGKYYGIAVILMVAHIATPWLIMRYIIISMPYGNTWFVVIEAVFTLLVIVEVIIFTYIGAKLYDKAMTLQGA